MIMIMIIKETIIMIMTILIVMIIMIVIIMIVKIIMIIVIKISISSQSLIQTTITKDNKAQNSSINKRKDLGKASNERITHLS